jgi:polygalacturonase
VDVENVYNVKAYGATGNGTTDDTSAIQAAITAAAAGGTVFFPKGTYKISSSLTLGSNVTLLGASAQTTIISQATANTNGVTLSSVSANSRILLTIQSPGGTVGSVYVNARRAGTSFSIKSTSATDTSIVAYELFEPG